MDSKEILETFGISKKFSILLFVQSIIVIIGCFLAFQDAYNNIMLGNPLLSIKDLLVFVVFIFLIYYSFIGFRKSEKYFKIGVYLYIITRITSLLVLLGSMSYSAMPFVSVICNVIKLILICYFAYNLDNYNKAKISILLLILVQIIVSIVMNGILGTSIELAIPKIIFLIPCISIALTYFARYNKEGFKQLDK